MKLYGTLFLLLVGYVAAAQSRRSVSSSIEDDERTLAIRVEGSVDGRAVYYDRQFNVVGMSSAQKDALKARVLDSLGLGETHKLTTSVGNTPANVVAPDRRPAPLPAPPNPPQPMAPADTPVRVVCATCAGRMKLTISGDCFSLTHEYDTETARKPVFPLTIALAPGKYRLTYWQNQVLQMQQTFWVEAGQDNVVTVK